MTIYSFDGIKVNTEDLTVDDMPTDIFREIFEICGVETAVSLLYHMNGVIVQVPIRGMNNYIKKLIRREYDGTTASIRAMARKFRLSEINIREILRQNKIQPPAAGQTSLNLFTKE